MRVIAVLDVDEEELAETGHSFEEEMGWASQSGITMKEYREADKAGEYEYAAFVWDNTNKCYEQMGRAVISEKLCRGRFNEYAEKGWFTERYDTSKVVFKKRLVSVLYAKWEEIKED